MKIDTSRPLSDILADVLRNDGTGKLLLEKRAESVWSSIVGPTVVRATSSVRVHDGILYVGLNSSLVRNELFYLKPQILQAINKAVGQDAISDIIFR